MGDFSVDLQKAYAIRLKGRTSLARKLRYWISDSELHCLACYRFGEFADDLRSRHRFAGLVMVALHRIWNRRVTHIDHCDISHSARIGPGLLLMHRHGVMIGPVVIGKNCVIHQGVTIGERVAGGDHGVPSIGDDVWIGPGAIITGDITVGDGATISAGTVLSRDVAARCLVGGNPGRVLVNGYDNSAILNYRVG
ncbi:MAG: serine O-acetyltransferase [Brooklawnia sp.]|jgi:serine O-acetyltransferase